MKSIILILIAGILLFAIVGCIPSESELIKEEGQTITYKGIKFNYQPLPIRNWKYRTDVFKIDENNCLLMEGRSWVDITFHEAHFQVKTNIDPCDYKKIKLNSSMESITYRESISPSSQIWIQGIKFSSHSLDNQTLEKYSHNLQFYSDKKRLSWTDDEGQSMDITCGGNLTFLLRCSGGENGSCLARFKICNIDLKEHDN